MALVARIDTFELSPGAAQDVEQGGALHVGMGVRVVHHYINRAQAREVMSERLSNNTLEIVSICGTWHQAFCYCDTEPRARQGVGYSYYHERQCTCAPTVLKRTRKIALVF